RPELSSFPTRRSSDLDDDFRNGKSVRNRFGRCRGVCGGRISDALAIGPFVCRFADAIIYTGSAEMAFTIPQRRIGSSGIRNRLRSEEHTSELQSREKL